MGIVKTAGRTATTSGIRQKVFRLSDCGGRSNIEPQALVNCAEAATGLYRLVPQNVRGKRTFGSTLQQALRNHLDACVDERRHSRPFAATKPSRPVHVKVAQASVVLSARVRDKKEQRIHSLVVPMRR